MSSTIKPLTENNLSIDDLAAKSDEALDKAYGYGRSKPGNTFGWQANVMSATYAKKLIDAGVTDIEKISDAIHKGWNVTAEKFVKDPDQFDDTKKLRDDGKLEAKLTQREKLMKINYSSLPEDEKEKDRVVARALLKAVKGISEGIDKAKADYYDKLGQTPVHNMSKDEKFKHSTAGGDYALLLRKNNERVPGVDIMSRWSMGFLSAFKNEWGAPNREIDQAMAAVVKQSRVSEAGPFSYGHKAPRKGTVAYNAAQSRKAIDKQPAIEPLDQMVGNATIMPDYEAIAAKHLKDSKSALSTPAQKDYAKKMHKRAIEASKMTDGAAAKKHYMGITESETASIWKKAVK